jgi:hypothetical protein
MYQAKVRHPLSPTAPTIPEAVDEAMWNLFVAIGDLWMLTDDPAPYRLRFRTFMDNRIAIQPLYEGYYLAATTMIADLTAQADAPSAYLLIYFNQNPKGLTVNPTLLQAVQQFVAGEFIAIRLALGSFANFGALNYRGYIGGANIPGEPAPYRTAKDLK